MVTVREVIAVITRVDCNQPITTYNNQLKPKRTRQTGKLLGLATGRVTGLKKFSKVYF